MKKYVLLMCFSVLSAFFLVGCNSSEKIASEDRLKDELYSHLVFSRFSDGLSMEISDFEVVKRQTNTENMIDTIWVDVKASSETVEAQMCYIMTYGLYNDGWKIDDIKEDNVNLWSFVPLSGVPDEEIMRYLPDNAEIWGNVFDIETGIQTVRYHYTESYRYCEVSYNDRLEFEFGKSYYSYAPGQWVYLNNYNVERYEAWSIDGTWQFYKADEITGEKIATVEIEDFDSCVSNFKYTEIKSDPIYISGRYNYSGRDIDLQGVGFTCIASREDDCQECYYTLTTDLTNGNTQSITVYRDKLLLNTAYGFAPRELIKVE